MYKKTQSIRYTVNNQISFFHERHGKKETLPVSCSKYRTKTQLVYPLKCSIFDISNQRVWSLSVCVIIHAYAFCVVAADMAEVHF